MASEVDLTGRASRWWSQQRDRQQAWDMAPSGWLLWDTFAEQAPAHLVVRLMTPYAQLLAKLRDLREMLVEDSEDQILHYWLHTYKEDHLDLANKIRSDWQKPEEFRT